MISTRAQVKNRALAFLDDPNQATFKETVFAEAFSEAWDALRAAFLQYQIPFSESIVTYTVAAGVTSFSPADAGIVGFGELVEIEERRAASTERWQHVTEKDKLSQNDPTDALLEFVWRLDSFELIGATGPREVRITYWDTGSTFPSAEGDSIGVDGAITFLAQYAAATMAPRKGYDELAALYLAKAVGSRYNDGVIGGSLWRLIQPMVRSRQRVQCAPKPYSVIRRRWQRRGPYIAANQPAGGGVSPAQFSTADGTITGTIDGVNPTFFLTYPVTTVDNLTVNGVRMTRNLDFTHGANVITFLTGAIPSDTTATITASGWL